MSDRTRIAVPNKGRLAEPTAALLRRAGFVFEKTERSLAVPVRNMPVELLFVRSEDIPELVDDGVADLGVTGADLVEEAGRPLTVVVRLGYGRCRLTAAVADASPVHVLGDFAGLRVATSHPNVVARFFAAAAVPVSTVPLRGSVEVAPKLDIADAIVDLVSTGSTLMVNGLRPVATLMESEAVLVAPGDATPSSPVVTMIRAVVTARRKRYVLMNAPVEAVATIERIIPGVDAPTVVPLAHNGKVAVHSVVDADEMWTVLPRLEAAGASGILVLPIEQMIP